MTTAAQAVLSRTVSVSLMWVFSIVVLFALEALAILVLSKFRAGIVIHQRLIYVASYAVHPLTGNDNRLSWSKIITGAVLAGYWVNGAVFMPQGVAYAIIAASHGTKVLMALIGKMNVNVTANESLTYAKSVVEQVVKMRNGETGEPLPGAPGQPLPAIAPAS